MLLFALFALGLLALYASSLADREGRHSLRDLRYPGAALLVLSVIAAISARALKRRFSDGE
jgi:hypothetical protein